MPTLNLTEIRQLCTHALESARAAAGIAVIVADSLTEAEADGIRMIGLGYLPVYCTQLRCGKVDGRALPRLRTPASDCSWPMRVTASATRPMPARSSSTAWHADPASPASACTTPTPRVCSAGSSSACRGSRRRHPGARRGSPGCGHGAAGGSARRGADPGEGGRSKRATSATTRAARRGLRAGLASGRDQSRRRNKLTTHSAPSRPGMRICKPEPNAFLIAAPPHPGATCRNGRGRWTEVQGRS